MKKIKLILIIITITFSFRTYSQDPTGATDATMMLGYWAIKDGTKLSKAAIMINSLKESVKAGASIYQSAQSLDNLLKEIQLDANSIGDFSNLKAQYIDTYIQNMEYDFNNAPYIDFYQAYMGETNRFRNIDGSVDMVQVAIDNYTETNSYNSVISDLAYQSGNANNRMNMDLANQIVKSRMVGAMVNSEDIRILNDQASNYERQAMLIHIKINVALLGGNNLEGAESADENRQFKRAYIAELQAEQEYNLDMARRLRAEAELLASQPLPVPIEIMEISKEIEANELQKQSVMINSALRSENRDIKSRWN